MAFLKVSFIKDMIFTSWYWHSFSHPFDFLESMSRFVIQSAPDPPNPFAAPSDFSCRRRTNRWCSFGTGPRARTSFSSEPSWQSWLRISADESSFLLLSVINRVRMMKMSYLRRQMGTWTGLLPFAQREWWLPASTIAPRSNSSAGEHEPGSPEAHVPGRC